MIPVSEEDALRMITELKAYPILKGVRGQTGVNIKLFAETIVNLSNLLNMVPEIAELDLNPLMASENDLTAVDVRIRLEKTDKKPEPNNINELA